MQVKDTMYSDRFNPTEYVTDTHGPIRRVLTSADLELIFQQYDVISIEYQEGFKFKASSEMFAQFIDENMRIKREASLSGNEGLRYMAKLRMNSLYGKFGTNPKHVSMKPVWHDGRVWYERLDPEMRHSVYIPLASFVTAWARMHTITAAQSVYERFIYSDTDSIYITGRDVPEGLWVDDVELGAWKIEHMFDRFKAVRAKTYVFEEGGRLYVHCAGMPERCVDYDETHDDVPEGYLGHVDFDNFELGAQYWGKLQNRHVGGGIVLKDGPFKIR